MKPNRVLTTWTIVILSLIAIDQGRCQDKITVSHTTYLLIKDEIKCEPKGEIEAKGFSEPVKIYEVKSEGVE